MRIPSVVASLVISTTIFVCVEPAWGQRPRPIVMHRSRAVEPVGTSIATALQNVLIRLESLEAQVATLQSDLAAETAARQNADAMLADVLVHFSRVGNDIFITGANLHIVNGTGDTETTNGLGNLIVEYNEGRPIPFFPPDDRTGSHMVVVGKWHNYSSYGGIVVGQLNATSNRYSSVSGGFP